MNCHCCSEALFKDCCEPYLLGAKHAPTPEALMRSRYSAFCLLNLDYVFKTMDPRTRGGFDRENNEEWAKSVTFTRLEVLKSSSQGDRGNVEFNAHYTMDDEEHVHHERSTFRRENGIWYFNSGEVD